MPKVVKLPQRSERSPRDPLDVNRRLYNQIHVLLNELERADVGTRITLRERIAAIIAIGRIQTIFVGLRKEPGTHEHSGSAVRKYEANFKNDTSKRKKIAGPTQPEPERADEPDDWFERAGITDDDDGDDAAE